VRMLAISDSVSSLVMRTGVLEGREGPGTGRHCGMDISHSLLY